MEGLGFELKQEASLNTLTDDVLKSSAIEDIYMATKRFISSKSKGAHIIHAHA